MKEEILKKDREFVWHPYTQMKDCDEMPPVPIKRAEGIKLFDYDGNFYYDTISSWWCNIHGHNHPYIKKAIREQLEDIDHILFAGFTHTKAVELAERLVRITPEGLNKVFYSDNGSTAVEVAIKMSFQFWQNTGKSKKTAFVSLDKAYHGDTVGTMSVSGVDLYNERFNPMFFKGFKAVSPCVTSSMSEEEVKNHISECLNKMEDILKEHSKEISAILVEPILMGAGGMIVYPAEYLKGVKELSSRYNVHLIADEVATGFGRTGKMFACEHAGITPDFICISKGVTSGYLPLGATITTNEVFDAFYADNKEMKTFYHGHTFTANPLACAAAVASIDLFDIEDTLGRIDRISSKLTLFMKEISEMDVVGNIRHAGVVGAFDIVKNNKTGERFDPGQRTGLKIYKNALKKGLLLRPLGDVLYFFLPYCVSDAELDDIFARTREVLGSIACCKL